MVCPVLYASSDDGYQHQVSSAGDVEDAVAAISAGVQPADAVGERPVPYRDWGAQQVEIYECLFDIVYDSGDAIYRLAQEISPATEGVMVFGDTITGLPFDFVPEHITLVPNTTDLWGPANAQSLIDISANLAVAYGTVETSQCSLDVACFVWQYDAEDGSRARFLEFVDIVDAELISDLDDWRSSRGLPRQNDIPLPYVTCEQAFTAADRAYRNALDAAKNTMDDCVIDAFVDYSLGLAGCTSIAIGLTLFSAGAGGPAGLLSLLTCAALLHASQLNDLRKCNNAYNNAAAAARATRQTARQNARDLFGEGNCPSDPA